jgi:peptidoglycan/LPS O-acetylase OafA/YrhL
MDQVVSGPGRLAFIWIVPAFFALSGFLVAGSMVRLNDVRVFVAFRVLRILPALALEVVLSALLLGPLVTALPLADYATDPGFARYFWNILGVIHYELPGVFLGNPWPGVVNGSLWTVPAELYCYIGLVLLMLGRVARHRRAMLAVFLLGGAALTLRSLLIPGPPADLLALSRGMLVMCFLAGNLLYLWRDRIPLDGRLCLLALPAYLGLVLLLPEAVFLGGSSAVAYWIVWLGMVRLPRLPLLMRGDYSYGIYLYAFPIQQALIWGIEGLRHPALVFLAAAPPSILFAMLSWHAVERPALRLRRRLAPGTAAAAQPASSGR